MNQEFEDAKREAYVRAHSEWIKASGRSMNEFEKIAFNLGFGEGRVSGGKVLAKTIMKEFK